MMSFTGKKILVTGGAGFIGSHLVDFLVKRKNQIFVIDDLSNGDTKNIEVHLKSNKVKLFKDSVENANLLDRIIIDNRCGYIFHLASGNLLRSVENPINDLKVTVIGILNILSSARKSRVKPTLVFSSTGSVYGEAKFSSQKEDHPLEPVSPYGISKMAAEKYVLLNSRMYGLPVVLLRYYNVYGPKQNFGAKGGVVGIFIDQALKGKPLIIEGSGKQRRCFTYVDDVVRANILAAMNNKSWGEVFNIAGGEIVTIKKLASLVMKFCKREVKIKYAAKRIGDVDTFRPDISKAKQILHYQPRVLLKEGLKRTISWFWR